MSVNWIPGAPAQNGIGSYLLSAQLSSHQGPPHSTRAFTSGSQLKKEENPMFFYRNQGSVENKIDL